MRTVSVDVGNDSVKALLGPNKTKMTIPNILAPAGRHRIIKEMEKNTLEGLHVSISSDCLKQRYGNYLVGELARSSYVLNELNNNSWKSNNDQTLVLLLTTLAIDAASCGMFNERDGFIEASYILSTGLPILEGTYENRMQFKHRLENCVHEVEFLQTPLLTGKKIRIRFDRVFPNIEGISAFVVLNERHKDLATRPVLVFDIGGLTTDAAVVINNRLNNDYSRSFNEGISIYLDRIINSLETELQYSIKSRKDLVNIVTNSNIEERNHIYHFGRKISIQSIVDTELMNFARKQVQKILYMWNLAPEIQVCYVLGGAAVLLKEYIQKVMQLDQQELPLEFLETEDSIWANAYSYSTILEAALRIENQQRTDDQ